MRRFFGIIIAAVMGVLALVAKYFQTKAERLEAESRERDAREREEVARMEERIAAVREAHRQRKPIDPKNRTDFE